jgi:hypothetical protein
VTPERLAQMVAQQRALSAEWTEKIIAFNREAAEKIKGVKREIAEADIAAENAAYAAEAGTYSTGYDRGRRQMDIRHQQALDTFDRANTGHLNDADVQKRRGVLGRTNAAESYTADADHLYAVNEQLEELRDRTEAATRSITPMAAEWDRMSRAAVHDLSLTTEQLETLRRKYEETARAEANKPLMDGLAETNIDLEIATHRVTALHGAIEKLALANPNADPKAIGDLANAQEKLWAHNWAREQLESVKNTKGMTLALADYVFQLNRAVKAGELSNDEARRLAQKKAFDIGLTAPWNAGDFNASLVRSGGAGAAGAGQLLDIGALNRDKYRDVNIGLPEKGAKDTNLFERMAKALDAIALKAPLG